MLKRTPLYDIHQSLGARLVEFGGWEMPVQYSSIIDEHLAVRKSSGLFDISHMGELFVSGSDALAFVNRVFTNDASCLADGEGQYTLLCNDAGGVVDDLYLFQLAEQSILLVVNASRISEVVAWLDTLQARFDFPDLDVENRSDLLGAVAIQGPTVGSFIDECFSGGSVRGRSVDSVGGLKKNEIGDFRFDNSNVWISRTGYTGEDGFEIIAENDVIPQVWQRLMAKGHQGCLQPIGLGARDTLRTEMGYPLYGHELSETISPLEAGLGFFVKLTKDDFVGKSALGTQKAEGLKRRSVGFKMVGKAPPPRPGYSVVIDGKTVGETTSGTVSPSLKGGIGLALVKTDIAKIGVEFSLEIRGRSYPAVSAKKPLHLNS